MLGNDKFLASPPQIKEGPRRGVLQDLSNVSASVASWWQSGRVKEKNAKKAKPVPNKISPMANLTGPLGFNLEAQIRENKGANKIINNEFNTENHEAGISVASTENSLFIIQITIPHIITKLAPKKMFERKKCCIILLNNPYKTNVRITIGTNVIMVLATLKIMDASPTKARWAKFLAKMVIEPPACSNAHQKKMVKMENTMITKSRSTSTLVSPALEVSADLAVCALANFFGGKPIVPKIF